MLKKLIGAVVAITMSLNIGLTALAVQPSFEVKETIPSSELWIKHYDGYEDCQLLFSEKSIKTDEDGDYVFPVGTKISFSKDKDTLDWVGLLLLEPDEEFGSGAGEMIGMERDMDVVTLTSEMIGKKIHVYGGGNLTSLVIVTVEDSNSEDITTQESTSEQSNNNEISVIYNGETLQFDLPIINKDGHTYYPLRQLIEGIGGTVEWEDSKAIGKLNGNTVSFVVGSNIYEVNGKQETLDGIAFIENENTYIPIKYACEGLGFTVDWDSDTQTITIK